MSVTRERTRWPDYVTVVVLCASTVFIVSYGAYCVYRRRESIMRFSVRSASGARVIGHVPPGAGLPSGTLVHAISKYVSVPSKFTLNIFFSVVHMWSTFLVNDHFWAGRGPDWMLGRCCFCWDYGVQYVLGLQPWLTLMLIRLIDYTWICGHPRYAGFQAEGIRMLQIGVVAAGFLPMLLYMLVASVTVENDMLWVGDGDPDGDGAQCNTSTQTKIFVLVWVVAWASSIGESSHYFKRKIGSTLASDAEAAASRNIGERDVASNLAALAESEYRVHRDILAVGLAVLLATFCIGISGGLYSSYGRSIFTLSVVILHLATVLRLSRVKLRCPSSGAERRGSPAIGGGVPEDLSAFLMQAHVEMATAFEAPEMAWHAARYPDPAPAPVPSGGGDGSAPEIGEALARLRGTRSVNCVELPVPAVQEEGGGAGEYSDAPGHDGTSEMTAATTGTTLKAFGQLFERQAYDIFMQFCRQQKPYAVTLRQHATGPLEGAAAVAAEDARSTGSGSTVSRLVRNPTVQLSPEAMCSCDRHLSAMLDLDPDAEVVERNSMFRQFAETYVWSGRMLVPFPANITMLVASVLEIQVQCEDLIQRQGAAGRSAIDRELKKKRVLNMSLQTQAAEQARRFVRFELASRFGGDFMAAQRQRSLSARRVLVNRAQDVGFDVRSAAASLAAGPGAEGGGGARRAAGVFARWGTPDLPRKAGGGGGGDYDYDVDDGSR